MLNLFSLLSFVQFVGAFNFAFVFTGLERKIYKYFLNANRTFKDVFNDFNERGTFYSVCSSVDKLRSLTLTTGSSNEESINDLKNKFSALKDKYEEARINTTRSVSKKYKIAYSRQLFLICGIYSTFYLIGLGVLEIVGEEIVAYVSMASYNFCMLLFVIYFVICEIFKHFKRTNAGIFKPTHLYSLLVSLALPLIFPLNWWIVNTFGVLINIPNSCVKLFTIIGPILTVSGFIVTMIAIVIYHLLSVLIIKRIIKHIDVEYNSLLQEKVKIDNVYNMFTPTL